MTPSVLTQMRTILQRIPETFSDLVGAWLDDNGLDLLHHSIINNCPEMVEQFLVHPKWFPPTHMPQNNPYAHLAATLGFVDCLRWILHFRPSDYFSASDPSHAIKLPASVRMKLKLADPSDSNRHKNKLLKKIQTSVDSAETAIQQMKEGVNDISEVCNILTNELKALEDSKNITGPSKRFNIFKVKEDKRRQTIVTPTTSLPPLDSVGSFPKTAAVDIADVKIIDSSKTTDKPGKIDLLPKCRRPTLGTGHKEHIITVDWDVFSDASDGVVKGAGEKVTVKYSKNALKKRPCLGLLETQGLPFLDTSKKVLKPLKVEPLKLPDIRKQRSMSQRQQQANTAMPKLLEAGVRGKKKYKDFRLKIDYATSVVKDESKHWRNKTPLSLAAENGQLECVKMILETFITKSHPYLAIKEPLTLATKARSPDAIMLLMDRKRSRTDFQSAVLTAMREMYPDCLTALLTRRDKSRESLFGGVNLYHVLYSQSLISNYRYEMLPILTNVLVSNQEDVNAHNVYCTFPMYTLISCAFNISHGKQIIYYDQCLKMLLEHKANPHFDEGKVTKLTGGGQLLSRKPYSSAINCILESAIYSTSKVDNLNSSRILMKKILTTVTTYDRTPRRLLNDVLFDYMNTVCIFGLDRYIVRCLLRYGANADFRNNGKYAINVYFDNILPYLSKFEVNNTPSNWQQELNALMLVCRGMSYQSLKEAELIFLNDHLMQCPIQALPPFRYFCYLIKEMLTSPRPLTELAARYIWLRLRRNEKLVKKLPLPNYHIALILP